MSLAEDEKNALVKYRLERAVETMEDVRIAVGNLRWFAAANRLYYVCFYAASALLINDGYEARTHSGVKALLGLHYVSTGKIDKILNSAFGKIFNLRQTGDYDDMAEITEDDIMPLIEPAENFIKIIEKLIKN
ncbi:MAG: HEPN domain-containing protein [Prevotellaceae bacterium]|jgi:uncharacterized protein (UPF0332 family)|nr:HEPN domain-containing protein [Prevotellaceae bacterium]